MKSGAATGENNASDTAQFRRRHVQASQLCGAFFQAEAPAHRIAHRVRLLKDFLEHIMRVIALCNVLGRELDLADSMIATYAGQRANFEFLSLYRNEVEIVQENGVTGVSNDCAHVTGQKVFVLPHA